MTTSLSPRTLGVGDSSCGPTSTVSPLSVVIHKPRGADLIWTTGRQSRSLQHSRGYQSTVEPSGEV